MAKVNCVLVAGTTAKEIQALLPFGQALAEAQDSTVSILGLIAVPSEASLSSGALETRHLRQETEGFARPLGIPVAIRVAHDLWDELMDYVVETKASTVLLDWQNPPPPDWLGELPCDLMVAKPPFPKKLKRVLLPIRGGPHAALALRLARALAKDKQAEISVLHAATPERKENYFQSFLQRLSQLPEVTRWVNDQGPPVESITRAARDHQMIVMGSAVSAPAGEPAIGATATQVLSESQTPALVVRSTPLRWRRPTLEPQAQPVDFTISVLVDKWFAENTFHASEFRDLRRLVELKEKQGLVVSLGLPTLNEEKTIGKIIRTIRAQFMERHHLLDEIVVIDSNSTDRTVEIAQGMGVPVVKHPEVLTQYEKENSHIWRGKGEALWNSLYILRGDLIAWIDTDIVNIHPRFVYGILGPLISNPHLMYVKGFYQRPLRIAGTVETRGGGRVTELVARPLLNLFYPELSGFVQPLAGEYAGRREALEQVPFFVGYGVEIGLLIDLWSRFKLSALGQVDLEERVHRNQSLTALSKMAFEIVQVVMQRVGEVRGVELVDELNKSMKLIRQAQDEFQLDIADIRAYERPPMIKIQDYVLRRDKFKSK